MKKFLVVIRDVVIVWGSGVLFGIIAPLFTLHLMILMPLSIIPYVIAFAFVSLSSEGRRFRHLALIAFLVWSLPIDKGVALLQQIFFGMEPNISESINPSSMYFIRFLFIGSTMMMGYGLSLIVLNLKTKKNLISIRWNGLAGRMCRRSSNN